MHKLRSCGGLFLTHAAAAVAFAFTGFRRMLPFAENAKSGSQKMVKPE